MSDAHRAAELAARASYGRLLAYLAARGRDVAAAEDALGDAFTAALETWPRVGVPDNPDAWLLVAARRRLVDGARHGGVEAEHGLKHQRRPCRFVDRGMRAHEEQREPLVREDRLARGVHVSGLRGQA